MYIGNIQTKPNQAAERRNKTYNREASLILVHPKFQKKRDCPTTKPAKTTLIFFCEFSYTLLTLVMLNRYVCLPVCIIYFLIYFWICKRTNKT